MAIETLDQHFSMMGIANPTRFILPNLTDGATTEDLAMLLWLYHGIALSEAVVAEPSRPVPRPRTLMFAEVPLAQRITVAVFISWSTQWDVTVDDTVTTFEEVEAPIQVPMLSLEVSDRVRSTSLATILFDAQAIHFSIQELLTPFEVGKVVARVTGEDSTIRDMIKEIVDAAIIKERIIRECEWLLGIGGSSESK